MRLLYKHRNTVTSEIIVDYKKETVVLRDYTDDISETAFGINKSPSFKDYEDLLESRCFPKNRDHMKLHLKELDLDFYSPIEIVRKTQGKLEGDFYSLEIVDE